MKVLKKILLVLVAFAAVFVVVSLFLPKRWNVARSVTIQAEAAAIFPYLKDLKKWPEWTVWTEDKDSTLKREYGGPAEGAGATMSWKGEKMGTGTLKLTSSDPKTGIEYDLSLENGQFLATGSIRLEAAAGATKVAWTDSGDVGWNLLGRYFVPFMDSMIGPDFQGGLENLKRKVEAK